MLKSRSHSHGGSRPVRRIRNSLVLASVVSIALLTTAACSSSGSGNASSSESKTIKIGIAVPLSGDNSALAVVGDGITSYLEYINAQGGVNGYKFTWKTEDTQEAAAPTILAARDLVSEGYDAIVGVGTPSIEALKPIAASLKVPILMAGNGAEFVPPVSNMFGDTPDYADVYPAVYKLLMTETGNGPIGLIYSNDANGQPGDQSIAQYARTLGVPGPVASLAVSATVTNCVPYMARLKADKAAGVVIAADAEVAACVVKAGYTIGYQPKYGAAWIASTAYASELGSLYPGQYVIDYQTPLSANTAAVQLYKATVQKYAPQAVGSAYTEQGWDEGAIIVDAVRFATSGGKAFSVSGLLDAMNKDFHGQPEGLIQGGITYNSQQHFGASSAASMITVSGNDIEKEIGPFTSLQSVWNK